MTLCFSAAQAILGYIRDNTDRLYVTTTAPASYSAASNQPQKIISANVTAADWTLTQNNLGPNLVFGSRTLTVEGSGSASHAVWARASGSTIMAMTEVCGTTILNSGANVVLGPWNTTVESDQSSAPLVVYQKPSVMSNSTVFSMTANGITVPVWTQNGHSYAWLAFTSPTAANCVVTYNAAITSRVLSPLRKAVSTTAVGNTISFALTQNGHYCLKVNGASHTLIILTDPLETNVPPSSGLGIYNVVTQYGAAINNTGAAHTAINNAIIAANAAGTGTVYIPPGDYRIAGQIAMKTNVSVYLAPGAILRWAANNGASMAGNAMIAFNGCTDAKLYGRGVLWGDGATQVNQVTAIHTNASVRTRIYDIMTIDNVYTPVRFGGADQNSLFSNMKIISITKNSDGIDLSPGPGTMTSPTIEKCFIQSTDDSIAFLGGQNLFQYQVPGNCNNLTIRQNFIVRGSNPAVQNTGSFLDCVSNAFGTPGIGDSQLSTMLFDDNDCLYLASGPSCVCFEIVPDNYDNFTYQNSRIEGPYNWLWLVPTDPGTYMQGYLHTVLFSNITADQVGSSLSSIVGASAAGNVAGVTWNQVTIAGITATNDTNAHVSRGAFCGTFTYQ